MSKLNLFEKYQVKTHIIPVQDEWIQFSVGMPEMDILESILQEKDDEFVLVLVQRMGVSVSEKKEAEKEGSEYLLASTNIISFIRSIASQKGYDESIVRYAMDNEYIALDTNGELVEKFDACGMPISKRVFLNEVLKPVDPDNEFWFYEVFPKSDIFDEESQTKLNQMLIDFVTSKNNYLDAVTVKFINNRIIDLETNKTRRFNYSIEDVSNLHNDLLDAVKAFVSDELFGYPQESEDEPEVTKGKKIKVAQ